MVWTRLILILQLVSADLCQATIYWLINFNNQQEVVIAPPAIYLIQARELIRKEIQIAAQNCYFKESGAYTGEIR